MTKQLSRICGWFLKGAFGLMVLGMLALAGGLLYLRTESGEALIARTLEKSLTDSGLEARIDSVRGPIPGRLQIFGFSLADERGPWLEVPSAEIEIKPWALLRGRLDISRLSAEQARLTRLPASGAAAGEETEPASDGTGGLIPDLPIAIDVQGIALSLLLDGEIVPQPLSLALEGGIALRAGQLSGALSFEADQAGTGTLHLRLTAENDAAASQATLLTLDGTMQPLPSPPPELVSPELSPLLAGGVTVRAVLSAPSDFAPIGVYHLRQMTARAENWSAEIEALNLRQQPPTDSGLRFDADGAFNLAVPNVPALTPLLAVALQDASARGRFSASFDPKAVTLSFKGDGSGTDLDGHAIGTTLSLDAKADLPDDSLPKLDAVLALSGENVPWPSPELSALFGPAITANFSLTGENGVYALDIPGIESGRTGIKGNASLRLPDRLALTELLDTPEAAIRQAVFDAAIDAVIAKPAQTDNPSPTHHPPLAFDIQEGSACLKLDGANGAAHARLTARSTGIGTETGALSGLTVTADAALSDLDAKGAAPVLSGTLTTAIDNALGTPFAASLSVQATPERVEIGDILAQGAGIEMKGGLSLLLGEGDAPPLTTGSLALRILDWRGLPSLTDLGLSGGSTRADVTLDAADGRQNIQAKLSSAKIALRQGRGADDVRANGLDIRIQIKDAFDTLQTKVTATGTQGSAGGIGWRDAKISLDGDKKQGRFDIAAKSPDLGFSGNWRLGLPLSAQRTQPHEILLQAARFNLPEKNIVLRARKPIRVGFGQGASVGGIDFDLGSGGSIRGSGAMENGTIAIDVVVRKLPFSLLSLATATPLPKGHADLDLALHSKPGKADGSFSLDVFAAVPGLKPPQTVRAMVMGRLTNKTFKGDGRLGLQAQPGQTLDDLTLDFSIPVTIDAQGMPMPAMKTPFSAHLRWQGEAEPLWRLAGLADRKLSGRGSLFASASGTLAAPITEMTASFRNGQYDDRVLGLLLTAISLEARQQPDGRIDARFSASDGAKGDITFQAAIEGLPNARGTSAAKEPTITLHGAIRALSPLHRDDLVITLSGPFSAEGPLLAPKATAEITVDQGTLRLLSSLGAGVKTLDVVEAGTVAEKPSAEKEREPELALRIILPNRFFINGRGLESEWRGDLSVEGTPSEPVLKGFLEPVRGRFTFLSKPFTLSAGRISFSGGSPPDPALNLKMTHKGASMTAIVLAQGTASRPKLALDSTPSMPKDEIMAQILFGKSSSGLSRFEALQVANSLRTLTGIGDGGFDLMPDLQSALGVDVLRMGGGSSNRVGSVSRPNGADSGDGQNAADISVEAGKYITDNVYVGVEQGASAESTTVRVEIELLPNLTIDSRSSPTSTGVGIGWKRDY